MVNIKTIKILEEINDSDYIELKANFLFHSNTIEGSSFKLIELKRLLHHNTVIEKHDYEDIIETKNSSKLFDFIARTLGEPILTNMYVN